MISAQAGNTHLNVQPLIGDSADDLQLFQLEACFRETPVHSRHGDIDVAEMEDVLFTWKERSL